MSSELQPESKSSTRWTPLLPLAELPTDGEGRTVELEGFRLAVFHFDGEVRVLDDECPHAGASLGAGVCVSGEVTCPWHGWHFRLSDGENTDGLEERVAVFASRVNPEGIVEVALG